MKKIFVFIKYHKDLDKVTEWKFYKVFAEQGLNVIPVIVNYSYIFEEKGKFYIKNKFIKNKFRKVEIEEGDIFFIRAASLSNRNSYRLLTHLQELGDKLDLVFYNGNEFIQMCNDKFRNYLFLKEQEIGTPDTYFVPYVEMSKSDKQLKNIAKQLGYPLIMKTVEGSMGTGVVKVESDEQIQSIAEILYKGNGGIILQKMIKADYDVRVFVWGNEIIASMRRNKVEGDFRSNVSKGSKAETYDLSKGELSFVEDIIKKVNEKYGHVGTIGIDYMVSGDDGSLQVLELNGSPGIKIKDITGIDVFAEIGKRILKDHPDAKTNTLDLLEESAFTEITEDRNNVKYINENYLIDYDDHTLEVVGKNVKGKIVERFENGYLIQIGEDEYVEILDI